MKTISPITTSGTKRSRASSLLAALVMTTIVGVAIAGVGTYVSHNARLAIRRDNWTSAYQFAEAGTVIACNQVNIAFTNKTDTFKNLMVGNTNWPYSLYSSNSGILTYVRTNLAPFTNQPVRVALRMTNSSTPGQVTIESSATVGGITRTNSALLEMQFGWAGAIISDHQGTSATGTGKSDAQKGNVTIPNPRNTSYTVIDGGILANGRVNVGNSANITIPPGSISMTNWSTGSQIPDYTLEGGTDQLFDFNRFIAVAKQLGTGVNYFTNVATFRAAANTAAAAGNALEGVVVVNVSKAEISTKWTPTLFPNGIRVRGTLLLNFAANVVGTDKLFIEANLYVNEANMAGFVRTNTATYPTGYPPVYVNPAKNPANVNISGLGFQNFSPDDDLPAIMYNVGIADFHGNVNVCGVVYTPSFMEIENKKAGNTQYFKGMLIGGNGVYIENAAGNGISVVSFDAGSLDRLATSGGKGKLLRVVRRY